MFEKGNRANTVHGILLIGLFSFAAFYLADVPFIKHLSLSPLIIGIILGMLYANSLRNKLPETWVPGIKFCSKQILRAGIVLYGQAHSDTGNCSRTSCHNNRYHYSCRYHLFRNMVWTDVENGQRHCTDDGDGKCHLRCCSRIGSRACRQMRKLQDCHCRINGSYFRDTVHVLVSSHVPYRHVGRSQ